MKIGVIGTGYVGLVTAVCLADLGHDVVGTDVVADKIDKASRGISHIYEPGLEELLKANLKKGNLNFTPDLDKAIQSSDVLFVSVNTPQKEDGSADMTFVESVSRKIADNLNDYKVVVEKSTVPVKTSMWIKKTITSCKKKDVDFDVASNPEFLREGSAVSDFLNPDRIIIGVDINLIADLCEKTDADVNQVAKGMGFDPRIGSQFLRAGLGYGGSCFPKDIRALAKIGEDLGVNMNLLREADRVNQDRIDSFVEKTKKALWILKDKKVAVLGLAFKPETDDIREAVSIKIIKKLLDEGSFLRLYDPRAMENMREIFPEEPPQISYVKSPYEAVKEANALLIITEWDEFKELDLKKIKEVMDNPVIIDGRNVYDPSEVRELGFEYYSIGRQ
jgi:UDPglucose 6-dehydrogenase